MRHICQRLRADDLLNLIRHDRAGRRGTEYIDHFTGKGLTCFDVASSAQAAASAERDARSGGGWIVRGARRADEQRFSQLAMEIADAP